MADKGLGKLLAKSIRRSRKGSIDGNSSTGSDDIAHLSSRDTSSLGRSTQPSLHHTAPLDAHGEYKDTSIVIHPPGEEDEEARSHGDEATSQVSYDSEDLELSSSHLERPPVSLHPSQIGYLTTNSPLIQADYYQGTRPSQDISATDNPRDAGPSGSHDAAGLAPPTSRATARSASPVGRIKGVFRSKKSSSKLSASSATSSPERQPAAPDSERSTTSFDGLKITVPGTEPQSSTDDQAATTIAADPAAVTAKHTGEKPAQQQLQQQPQGLGERLARLSLTQTVEAATPPGSPPSSDKGTPTIVNTPPTPVNSSSPRFDSPTRRGSDKVSGGSISERRARAGSASIVPSKLSTISSIPLTPIESVAATPTNQPTGGFFNSVISAAQSAAQNLSNTITITGTGHSKIKSPAAVATQTQQENTAEADKVEVEPSAAAAASNTLMKSQEPASKTIGMGDLSFSQLGISEPVVSRSPTPTTAKFPEHRRSRSESAPVEVSPIKAHMDAPWDEAQRPITSYEPPPYYGDRTPPTGSVYEEPAGVHRSGSVRSALGRRHNRKRGSTSGTGGTGGTGTTIGAALSAVNSSLGQPGASIAPKLTGFAVASKKRNRDFHTLFKSVPDDDYLIEDYSCALQREILAHGRLYVSEGHLCFSSNILGWVTTLVMSFDEIVSVEKRSTALLFKNGLMISTLHAKHIFASFASRDSTYDLIVKIWKLGHPGLQSSLNGVRLDDTGGDKTEKIDAGSVIGDSRSASPSEAEEESDDGEDVYDEDEEDEDESHEMAQASEAPLAESALEKPLSRKPSAGIGNNNVSAEKPKDAPATTAVADFPGPATHAPTDCGDADTHYQRVTGDDVVPLPLGKVYDTLFGNGSAVWMAKFLTVDQKCRELQMEDKRALSLDNKTRSYTYIKPLNASIGPKQTKCIITENLETLDLEKAVNVLITTQNPDVPNGNLFSVKTKYCLSWAENNATRVQISCVVEWTGKSWLKGPIENGAYDGQGQYCKDLFVALKASVAKRSPAAANGTGGKTRKRGKKGKAAAAANVNSDAEDSAKNAVKQDWGMLEPLHGVLGPVIDIGKPLMTGNVVYGLLVGLLVAAWFGFGFTNKPVAGGPYGVGVGMYGYPDRLAAYEAMWRREESELWEWLEERVGMDRLQSGEPQPRKRVIEARTVEERLQEDRMDEREIKEAIRITEEKLRVLKSVVEKDGQTTTASAR